MSEALVRDDLDDEVDTLCAAMDEIPADQDAWLVLHRAWGADERLMAARSTPNQPPSKADFGHMHLFDYVCPASLQVKASDADGLRNSDGKLIGCLTQIKTVVIKYDLVGEVTTQQTCRTRFAWTEALTDEIFADDRIPVITALCKLRGAELREKLNVFAEWQRRLRKEFASYVPA